MLVPDLPGIHLAILEDHYPTQVGYFNILNDASDIAIVGTVTNCGDLLALLESQPVDVVMLDLEAPVSTSNTSPYPALTIIPDRST